MILPIAAFAVLVGLAVVVIVDNMVTAIKGTYALIGILIAISLQYLSSREPAFSETTQPIKFGYLTLILALSSVPLTVITNSRLPALLTIVPLCYLCIWLQINKISPMFLITQLVAVYFISPVTKVLTTGLYFENGDVFKHVHHTNELIASGHLWALGRYSDYPGYHLLTGTISLLTGFSPYHSMVVLQLVLFTVLIPIVYFIALTVFEESRRALLTAFALTMIYTVSRYSSIYFPQSIAVLFLTALLYLAFVMKRRGDETWRSWSILVTLVGVATIMTHHLTSFIFLPVIAAVLIGRYCLRYLDKTIRVGPETFPLVAFGFGTVVYWVYEQNFISELIYHTSEVFQPTATSTEWRTVVTLGKSLTPLGWRVALRSLVSPEGIYFALLVAVVALGIVLILRSPSVYFRAGHLVVVGILTSPLLLRTPIAPDVSRIRFPLAIFFAFIVGPGLEWLWRTEFDSQMLRVIPAILVITLGMTGVLVASHDLYAFNAGPDLYELRPLPEPEKELSRTEVQELQVTSDFVRNYGNGASTLSMTGRALKMLEVSFEEASVSERGFRTSQELFVYREAWTDHRVSFTRGNRIGTVVISDAWFDRMVATENKVYTTGDTGILWTRSGGNLGTSTPASSVRGFDVRFNQRENTGI
ncbi:hypothetical protein [Halorussus rarus]|uniref:hypothetical protein n=1 Tax=Halorussus rarus TaxID=660515 RepID=UPI0013B3D741|nr:hypothetical protein [Halorussus rarus]